jgi:hypothetical protein
MVEVLHNQTKQDAARAEPAACADQRNAGKGATGSFWSAAARRSSNASPSHARRLRSNCAQPSSAD